ncbi:PLDc N-terminal domain-containing protein [Oculatella sp. LEGE 06141]|uniref:PLDc N-terminal domain-containing protein n=1 Tax=Oculatella sp. LEGE 06141 TaxID=1828648 RepID=UPI001D13BFBB|nr:PLDc N-terminal domain-containing protein [Oculatella sp. LEGE 06141]
MKMHPNRTSLHPMPPLQAVVKWCNQTGEIAMSHRRRRPTNGWKMAAICTGLATVLAIPVIVVYLSFISPFLSVAVLPQPISFSATWDYGQFMQRVEAGSVESVNISNDRTVATATLENGDRVRVNLPNDPDLLSILNENDVAVAIVPQSSIEPAPLDASSSRLSQFLAYLVPLVAVIPILLVVLGLAFWLWVLVDCVTQESDQGNNKLVWVIIILVMNWVGALIYFLIRRPQRLNELGQ